MAGLGTAGLGTAGLGEAWGHNGQINVTMISERRVSHTEPIVEMNQKTF